ncbi:gliding motility-associated C-terminal domain-containing protein [Winogradskyella sp. PG-2]|uniref:gliding motility-associated C-terminal domain-containing protein n=1 Tax=Winogradskyella sp. PG-2 TaxID=754409 RepID=UPI0004588257|nr:T9SS C-terminal target domain-containing protein [Winogradskyella sp. PG-2]BAO76679.1 hypothetical protein WPG_2449 [Winogradskyella sp. PG-2]
MNNPKSSKAIIIFICFLSSLFGWTQCPTVDDNSQSFCDLESLFISDLQASDQGAGIGWFDSSTSTTPLANNISLIDGQSYFLDNASGDCGSRIEVTVEIIGPPTGLSFQGVCVEDPSEATIADLEAIGNDVNWYIDPSGGIALDVTEIILDNTIYYADQSNSETGCRTSRLAVLVNIGLVPPPTGNNIQEFCATPDNIPTVSDLVASGTNLWYPSFSSASPFDEDTPLVNGETYYATVIDLPCESSNRLEVLVEFLIQPSAGMDATLDLCAGDTNIIDLFSILGGTPESGGTWTPSLNSGTGIFDPTIDTIGAYTYIVTSNNPICPDASATVTIANINPPNAGSNGNLNICQDDTNIVDLFNILGGTPDTVGTWSPALNSGTGIFDPTVDPIGTYTYTVNDPNNTCPDASANVTISLLPPPDAGTDATVDLCVGDTNIIDLFNSLGGTPESGGTWSPALNSGTGIFDPTVDPLGTYTYTVTDNTNSCPDNSATVTITNINPPNAGSNGTLGICQDDTNIVDLFNNLGGTPDTGGTWSPALNSGTGIFDPIVDPIGTYTYTVNDPNNTCPDASANVTISLLPPPDAGTDATVDLCVGDTNIIDLFNSLGGTPESGGTWSPALNSGTGIFDPTVDPIGTYTYTVTDNTNSCPDNSATVTITNVNPPNAGSNGVLNICQDDTNTVDLFNSLGGTPDTGGTWSPALNSGTGVFDPTIDPAGTYTYTVNANNCGPEDASEIILSFTDNPDLSGLEIEIPNVCVGRDVSVLLFNISSLVDDSYTITFEITSSGSSFSNTVTESISNGEITIIIPANLFTETGVHTFSIISFLNANSLCPANLAGINSINFEIFESTEPQIIADGNTFCIDDTPTLNDLTNNLIDTTGIQWFDSVNSSTPLPIDTDLVDGETYYASLINSNGCISEIRLEVTVSIEDCNDELIIPDGFSPNGDSINDTFHIVNLDTLFPNFKLTIFNRNGNKLYEGNINSPEWDGTSVNRFGNSKLPVGIYFYILEFKDGVKDPKQGRVYLSR